MIQLCCSIKDCLTEFLLLLPDNVSGSSNAVVAESCVVYLGGSDSREAEGFSEHLYLILTTGTILFLLKPVTIYQSL